MFWYSVVTTQNWKILFISTIVKWVMVATARGRKFKKIAIPNLNVTHTPPPPPLFSKKENYRNQFQY